MSRTYYHDGRYKRARTVAFARDQHTCQECKRYGKSIEATMTHHIIPVEWCIGRLSYLIYSASNLISLCNKCHEKMHIRANGELTAAGWRLIDRRQDLKRLAPPH